MDNNFKVEFLDIESITPYPNNPRINEEAVASVAGSIKEFGWKQPIVVDKEMVIVVGHTRFKAAQRLKLDKIPVLIADDLTEAQIKAYRIADNKVSEKSDWDFPMLAIELKGLEDFDFDLESLGFDDKELEDLLKDDLFDDAEIPDGLDDFDPTIKTNVVSKVGDVWHLGNHKLICGDCTDPNILDLVNPDNEPIKLCFTSPPYDDQRVYEEGQDLSVNNIIKFIDVFKEQVFIMAINLGLKRKDGELVEYWNEYINQAKDSGYKFLSWNIWDRGTPRTVAQHNAMFGIAHEFIFVFGKEVIKLNNTIKNKYAGKNTTGGIIDGGIEKKKYNYNVKQYRKMDSITRVQPAAKNETGHLAIFPAELPFEYIKGITDKGDIVLDPFVGSGTTIIASDELNRVCYGIELSEANCDLILNRWLQRTGNSPIRHDGIKYTDLMEVFDG